MISDVSIEAVPTKTGAPFVLISKISVTIASSFSYVDRKIRSFASNRIIGLLVGITTTLSP